MRGGVKSTPSRLSPSTVLPNMSRPALLVWALFVGCCFLGVTAQRTPAQRPSAQRPANASYQIPGAPSTPVPSRSVLIQWSAQGGCSENTEENPILCGPDDETKQAIAQQYGLIFTVDSFGGWSSYSAATVEDAFSTIDQLKSVECPFFDLIQQVTPSYLAFLAVLPQECASGFCPNYGMNAIRAPNLWNRLVAVPNLGAAATARRGCVIDSGIRFNHPDLTPNILQAASRTIVPVLAKPGNTLTPPAGGDIQFAGPDITTGPDRFTSGHGTHVAGIMAGVWNAVVADFIVGVNGQNARIASCRVFDDQGPGTRAEDIGACITHAVNNNLLVINLSLGGYIANAPAVERNAIQAACNAGAIVVVSAGNGVNNTAGDFQGVNIAGMTAATSPNGQVVSPSWPANFAGAPGLNCVLTVAATDVTNTLTFISNYGNNVRIAAPGDSIDSDINLPLTDPSPTAFLSGTSMAAPHVAGAALLLFNAFPAATNLDVINCLVSTGNTSAITSAFNGQTINGGLLDVNAAYDCLAARFGVSCIATPLVINLPQAGSCLSATVNPAQLFTAAPGVTATVSSTGPFAPGTHTVVVTPNNGAAPCQVVVRVVPCPPIRCRETTVQLTNTAAGSCNRANVPVSNLFTGGPPGVVVTANPASPYTPGTTVVIVTPTSPSGLQPCTAAVTVLPCKPECQDVITNTCANPRLCTATIKSESFVKASSVGNTATGIFLNPGNPYGLGTTNVRAIVSYPGINSVASEPCKVTVAPCKPKCRNVTVNTSPGICTGVVTPDVFIDLLSVGECVLPLTTNNVVQTPPSPYPLGTTSVTAVVKYPGNIVSPKTDACTVTVLDKELPKIVPNNKCLIVDKYHKKDDYTCYSVPQLATVTDNCPGVKSKFTACTAVPVPKGFDYGSKFPSLCAIPAPDKVCPLLGYLKPKEPRFVTVTINATDTSANSATGNTLITLNADLGDKFNPPNCAKV